MATLKTFEEGDTIYASETNANNQALLSLLTDNATQVQKYVEGEVASIKSNVVSVQQTLQNNINNLKEQVEATIHIIEAIKDGNYWRRTYSDGWCVQGGVNSIGDDRTGVVNLKQAYIDTSYHVQATFRGSFSALSDAGIAAWPRDAKSINIRNGSGGSMNVSWRTEGYINLEVVNG